MWAMREDDVLPRWWYASEDVNLYSQNSAHGHQPKRRSVLCGWRAKYSRLRSRDVSARFGASTLGETLTTITTQSSIVEGSRLQKRGRVSTSILACTNTLQSNLEPKPSEPEAPGEESPSLAMRGILYRGIIWHHSKACDVTKTLYNDVISVLCDTISWHYVVMT